MKIESGIKGMATIKAIIDGNVKTATSPAPGKRQPRPAARNAGDSAL
jgi:hypothetical protein